MYEQDETFDSRERKKSRYLSYPYTNMGPGHKGLPVKTEDSETPSHSHQIEGSSVANNRSKRSCTTAKSSTKKLRSKWCRKHIRWSAMSSGREFGKASSSELLSGLYSKALDCNFPCKNRKSDLVEWFFSAFRLSTFRDEAELAAILENRKSGNSGTPVRNDSLSVNGEQKKTKMGQTRKRKNQSLPSQSDMNKDIAASEFLSRCSAKTNNEGLGESMEDVKPAVQLQNVRSTTGVGSSRGKRSLTSKASRPKKTKKLEVCLDDPRSRFCSNSFDGGEKSNKSSSFVIDLQMVPLPRNGSPEKSNGKNKVEVDLTGSNPELYASHIDVGNLDNGFSPKNAPAEHLKTNRATVIPDLNDIGFEDISTQKKLEGDNGFSPELKAKHKQRKDSKPKSELSRSIFSGADAEKAFRNLKQNRPFGATLVDHNDSSETIAPLKQCEPIAGHSGSKPPHCERPSLEFIRQSLEMMASTLEKKGHTISQQMRDKLEGEIKNLMEKVNSIGSPSMKD
ncbi:uncharacterized protein LOC129318015 isoform X2 [Prosopis cineraria]|uniref:uncharacterized protein LOC129318015 isoform X2 n=1 Tax=Prosopis cineraria TaxID=364024 RepID=UPI00240F02A6|nr:uncharacterized protein LOC129318015 isoform X2 [Prosopis cineraria]